LPHRFTSKNPSTPQGKKGRLRKKEYNTNMEASRNSKMSTTLAPLLAHYCCFSSDAE